MLAAFCAIALCKSAMVGESGFIWEGGKMLGAALPVTLQDAFGVCSFPATPFPQDGTAQDLLVQVSEVRQPQILSGRQLALLRDAYSSKYSIKKKKP